MRQEKDLHTNELCHENTSGTESNHNALLHHGPGRIVTKTPKNRLQIAGMASVIIVFAAFGFMSPASRVLSRLRKKKDSVVHDIKTARDLGQNNVMKVDLGLGSLYIVRREDNDENLVRVTLMFLFHYKDNDDDKIDIKQSSGGNVMNTDDGA
ncbi:hypothetical protein Tco_0716475 [Tanacetum coccineum]